jgi:hypothetical protein
MSETWPIRCDIGAVWVRFYQGPEGVQYVELTIGSEERRLPLAIFCKQMLPISEAAVRRSAGWAKNANGNGT